ncbi:MAG TPA: molybdopterin cofactor-binding domain-containing protein [Gaiellaceae bacterium]|jgi:CO/xanthine dehydrogenase Mo-binding subunit|nr:molybdopterin cofactor-binding domain-containing protein [Gaiellaceae bacterium]
MTGLITERALSRRSFVKGGGAMILGFSLLGSGLAGKAAAAADPFASFGPADSNAIDSWLVINEDNTASLKLGKVELGQGSMTGLLMVAAEELNMDMSQMRWITNDTDVTPNQGTTAGSSAISTGGKQTRAAAAAAQQALLGLAATQLGVPAGSLTVAKGIVSGGGKTVAYGSLLGGKLFNVEMPSQYNLTPTTPPTQSTAQSVASPGSGSSQGLAAAEVLPTPAFVPSPGPGLSPGAPGTKPVSQYSLVGVAPGPQRVDIPSKVTGTYTYVHNIRIPGMLHGRIVRPRGQGAYGDGTNPKVMSVDASSISHIAGAKVLQKNNFLGVVAPKEYDAIQAAVELKVTWADMPALPGDANIWSQMRQQDTAGMVPAALSASTGNVDAALATAAHTVSETYTYPYNAHVPIGPTCAVADVTTGGARIFSNTQNAYATRSSVAGVLGLNANQVRVTYYEGSSVYGNAPYDDAAEAAAIMSQLADAPVRLQFMRWDEHGWDNYGPPQLNDVRGGVDANGNLVATDMTIFTVPWYTTKPTEAMLGYQQVFSTSAQIDTTNNGTQYNLKNRRVLGKSLPVQNNYLKTIWLRAPAAPQTTFAYEQMIDELAYAAKMDPYQFRLQNIATQASDQANGVTALTWDRWKNVLTRAAQLANWQPKVAASQLGTGNIVTGRGIALGSFAGTPVANIAEIQVNRKTGKITPLHFYTAQDTGLTVYPEGIMNQAVGSLTQGASRALVEEVAFGRKQVTSLDWVTYPIMRFKDSPTITFDYIQRTDIPATSTGTLQPNGTSAPSSTVAAGVYVGGSGEPPSTSIGAAMANAFFDATGVRMRTAPMTSARVRATLAAAATTG